MDRVRLAEDRHRRVLADDRTEPDVSQPPKTRIASIGLLREWGRVWCGDHRPPRAAQQGNLLIPLGPNRRWIGSAQVHGVPPGPHRRQALDHSSEQRDRRQIADRAASRGAFDQHRHLAHACRLAETERKSKHMFVGDATGRNRPPFGGGQGGGRGVKASGKAGRCCRPGRASGFERPA